MKEKLVRDRMPELCKTPGWTEMNYRRAGISELKELLLEKLLEEATEVYNAKTRQQTIEELADLQEVILGIYNYAGIRPAEVEAVRKVKADSRGGFFTGIVWDGKK